MAIVKRTDTDTHTAVVSPSGGTGHDFVTLVEPSPQVCCVVFGAAGTGKTTVGVKYAPQPVALINFDKRATPAVLKAQSEGRRILYCEIDYPAFVTRVSQDEAKKIGQASLDKTLKNLEWAVRESEKGNIRSIVIDTITELEEIATIAVRGRLDKAKKDYGESKGIINRTLWSLFSMAREGRAHLIALSRASEIWVGGAPSGQYKARCSDVVNDAVDWAGHIRVNVGGVSDTGKKILGSQAQGPKFEMEIKKAGVKIDELLNVYSEDEWQAFGGPFAYACFKQYPEYPLESWQ